VLIRDGVRLRGARRALTPLAVETAVAVERRPKGLVSRAGTDFVFQRTAARRARLLVHILSTAQGHLAARISHILSGTSPFADGKVSTKAKAHVAIPTEQAEIAFWVIVPPQPFVENSPTLSDLDTVFLPFTVNMINSQNLFSIIAATGIRAPTTIGRKN
jgi:hypothetical protein